jgi:N-acetyltransferase
MSWALNELEKSYKRVRIRRLQKSDFDEIANAINDPDCVYSFFWGANSPDKIINMLETNFERYLQGRLNPFVYFVDQEVAGITNFLRIDERRRSLEIGGTWIAPKWRRTEVNSVVKRMLLDNAFATCNAERVEFSVFCKNFDSQMAVLRLGANFEGVLRRVYINPEGLSFDGHLYSIIRDDWPKIKNHLDSLIDRKFSSLGRIPFELESSRVLLRQYRQADSEELFYSFSKNRFQLLESFPGAAKVNEKADSKSYIAEKGHRLANETAGFYGIWTKDENPKLIGQVHIKDINWGLRSVDIGYYIEPQSGRIFNFDLSSVFKIACGRVTFTSFLFFTLSRRIEAVLEFTFFISKK